MWKIFHSPCKKGLRVTHFDLSQPMIDKAKELAAKEGVLVVNPIHITALKILNWQVPGHMQEHFRENCL